MYFVYVLENLVSGKMYVGQTSNPSNRQKQHFSGVHHGTPLIERAILKYGTDQFDFVLLESLLSLEDANLRETYWIEELETLAPGGYNLKEGGLGGGPDSPETRLKKSLSKQGKQNSFYGKKHSEETKRKISLAKTGVSVKLSQQTREWRRKHMLKLNRSRTGRPLSEEHKAHIATGQRGKTHSEESKRKMSETRRKWWSEQRSG